MRELLLQCSDQVSGHNIKQHGVKTTAFREATLELSEVGGRDEGVEDALRFESLSEMDPHLPSNTLVKEFVAEILTENARVRRSKVNKGHICGLLQTVLSYWMMESKE